MCLEYLYTKILNIVLGFQLSFNHLVIVLVNVLYFFLKKYMGREDGFCG